MTMTLNPRTTVSGVNELLSLREQIDALTFRLDALAPQVVSNAEFQDGKLLHVPYYEAKVRNVPLGTLYHLATWDAEGSAAPTPDILAHAANRCPQHRHPWCHLPVGERVKTRYTREPRRSWHTFLGTWMLLATDDGTETATFIELDELENA